MKRAWLCLATVLSILASDAARAQEEAPPARERARQRSLSTPDRVEDYKEAGDAKLQMHIFLPAGHQATDRRPAIVFFFGGGWRSGSPAQFYEHCRHLASRGMVALAADYRVQSRHQSKVADSVRDAKSAIRWTRRNADRLGIDPDRIAAGGGSAGGHLAAATAVLPGLEESNEDASISARPNALALFNPVLDLRAEAFDRRRERRAPEFLERLGAEPEALSPQAHVTSQAPPAIVFHGKNDITVPYAQAEAFAKALKAAGVRCELAGYDDQGHGFFNYGRGDGAMYRDTLTRTDAFFVSLGWIEKPGETPSR